MSTVVLIDISNLLHREFAIHAQDGDVNATAHRVVEQVRRLAYGQPNVAICCDSGPSFRKDISPEYKANRRERDPSLYHQQANAIEKLRADGFPIWAAKGFEADDIIATATRLALERDDETEVLLVTSDKDLCALIGPRVQMKRPDTGAVVDEAGVAEKFGVPPSAMVDYLCLVGDASDNIRGAKGIGPKTAAKWLKQFGSLRELYRDFHAASATQKKDLGFTPAVIASLEEFAARVDEVRTLVTLRADVDIPFDEVFAQRVPAPPKPEDDHGFSGSFEDGVDTVTEQEQQTGQPADAPVVEGTIEPAQDRPAHAPMQARPSQALAVASPQGLTPRNLDEAFRLSKAMYISKQFSAHGSPESVMATILAGDELGLKPMASLRAIHMINGKPALHADLIRAKALEHPECKYFRCTERVSEPGKERATFITKRGDDPEVSLTFTIEEAQAAGYVKSDSGWVKTPVDMCVARASAKLARLVFPEACFGLYTPEELREAA